MKELREIYFSMQMTLFPMLEEEKIELSDKMLIEKVKAYEKKQVEPLLIQRRK